MSPSRIQRKNERIMEILNATNELEELVQNFNCAFKYQLILMLFALGLPLLNCTFYLFLYSSKDFVVMNLVGLGFGLILNLANLFGLCAAGSSITDEVKKIIQNFDILKF